MVIQQLVRIEPKHDRLTAISQSYHVLPALRFWQRPDKTRMKTKLERHQPAIPVGDNRNTLEGGAIQRIGKGELELVGQTYARRIGRR